MSSYIQNICDCHVHFGQFAHNYHSAKSVQNTLENIGIQRACVMPTGFFSKKEFLECLSALKTFPKDKYDSFLWLSPRILRWMPVENLYKLHNFKAIKIHFIAHPDWYYNQNKIHEIAEYAGEKNIPIMFHTGDYFFCEPQVFEPFCKEHPQTTFILAHARPANQTISIMEKYQNAWTDTAFTPIEDVAQLIKHNLTDRILWGTDFPIFVDGEDAKSAYIQRINQIQEITTKEEFEKIMWKNYKRLFDYHHTIA